MENKYSNLHLDIEDDTEEDALSLCDLPLTHDHIDDSDYSTDGFQCTNSPSQQDLFEFSADGHNGNGSSIIFCGRTVSYREQTNLEDEFYHFLWRSDSFSKSGLRSTNGSSSLRFVTSKPCSGNYKKHKVVFGVKKIPTKMELSDIRKRQSRRNPAPMFPVDVIGEEVVAGGGNENLSKIMRKRQSRRSPAPMSPVAVSGGEVVVAGSGDEKISKKMELSNVGKKQSRRNPTPVPIIPVDVNGDEVVAAGCGGAGRSHHHWGLLRPLRCRAHLASALARASFGCMSHV